MRQTKNILIERNNYHILDIHSKVENVDNEDIKITGTISFDKVLLFYS